MHKLPHLRKQGRATQLVVEGKPFIIIGGEIHNSSASSLDYMERMVWDRVVALNCNTVLAPVYWELIEPHEGRFDFSLVDGLLRAARKRKMRLIPLWFGTWKNAMSTYAPAWVKTDFKRFPRAQPQPDCRGAISCISDEACRADARAFRALMRHLRVVDAQKQTVIMVQVENETGLLGPARDHCLAAEKRFQEKVPAQLIRCMKTRKETLRPELHGAWQETGFRSDGNWTEVFGSAADETFMAWHVARYVDRVAEAGRAEYPLPCFANAWLVQSEGQKPGDYPGGGPVSRMMDIWQCAAPNIALLAPDIYLEDFAGICADYSSGGNPLLIPEADGKHVAAAHVFYALGRHDAMGFSPFGIESVPQETLLGKCYELLAPLIPTIAAHQGLGRMTGVLQGKEEFQKLELGNYRLNVRFHAQRQAGKTSAAALIIAETPDQFIIAGLGGMDIGFHAPSGDRSHVDFLSLEEGKYGNGRWIPGRRLNGDEYVVRLRAEPSIYRARLYCFK